MGQSKTNVFGHAKKESCALLFLMLGLFIFCLGQNPPKKTQALFEAAQKGNLQHVLALLDRGIDVNCRGPYNYTPLIVAARYNQMEIVRALCDRGAEVNVAADTAEIFGEWGATPLLWAAKNCHVEMAEFLISKGAGVEWRGGEGDTPLMIAAWEGCLPIVTILIAKGVAIDAVREYDKATALVEAVSRRHLDIATYLIDHGANIGVKDNYGRSMLLLSASSGSFAQVKYFFEKGLSVNDKDRVGSSAIFYAIGDSAEKRNILEFLIEHGVDPSLKGKSGISPLMIASLDAVESQARLLIDHGAAVNDSDLMKSTPLHWALRRDPVKRGLQDSVATIKLLLAKGAQVNAVDSEGKTPLSVAAHNPSSQVIEILLENGAQANIKDKHGWTAIMYAADWNQTAVIKVLARRGADLNLRNSDGNTALSIAKNKKSSAQAYELLKSLGAK